MPPAICTARKSTGWSGSGAAASAHRASRRGFGRFLPQAAPRPLNPALFGAESNALGTRNNHRSSPAQYRSGRTEGAEIDTECCHMPFAEDSCSLRPARASNLPACKSSLLTGIKCCHAGGNAPLASLLTVCITFACATSRWRGFGPRKISNSRRAYREKDRHHATHRQATL